MADDENEIPPELQDQADLYLEPIPKPKVVRVLTVLAYMLSVSMAAILLSVYYVFMWDGQPTLARMVDPRIDLNDSNYTELHEKNLENVTPNNEEFDLQRNTSNENVTEYPIKPDKSTSYQVIVENNNQLVESNKTDTEKFFEESTDLYADLYPSTSTITSPTEDNLLDDINEEIEDSTIAYPSRSIRNNFFYSKYLYRKLRML